MNKRPQATKPGYNEALEKLASHLMAMDEMAPFVGKEHRLWLVDRQGNPFEVSHEHDIIASTAYMMSLFRENYTGWGLPYEINGGASCLSEYYSEIIEEEKIKRDCFCVSMEGKPFDLHDGQNLSEFAIYLHANAVLGTSFSSPVLDGVLASILRVSFDSSQAKEYTNADWMELAGFCPKKNELRFLNPRLYKKSGWKILVSVLDAVDRAGSHLPSKHTEEDGNKLTRTFVGRVLQELNMTMEQLDSAFDNLPPTALMNFSEFIEVASEEQREKGFDCVLSEAIKQVNLLNREKVISDMRLLLDPPLSPEEKVAMTAQLAGLGYPKDEISLVSSYKGIKRIHKEVRDHFLVNAFEKKPWLHVSWENDTHEIVVLPKKSLLPPFIGDMTGCCQTMGGVGEEAALQATFDNHTVVYRKKGSIRPLFQAYVWQRKNYLVCDNIEPGMASDEVVKAWREWGAACVERYGYKDVLVGTSYMVTEYGPSVSVRLTPPEGYSDFKGKGFSLTRPFEHKTFSYSTAEKLLEFLGFYGNNNVAVTYKNGECQLLINKLPSLIATKLVDKVKAELALRPLLVIAGWASRNLSAKGIYWNEDDLLDFISERLVIEKDVESIADGWIYIACRLPDGTVFSSGGHGYVCSAGYIEGWEAPTVYDELRIINGIPPRKAVYASYEEWAKQKDAEIAAFYNEEV